MNPRCAVLLLVLGVYLVDCSMSTESLRAENSKAEKKPKKKEQAKKADEPIDPAVAEKEIKANRPKSNGKPADVKLIAQQIDLELDQKLVEAKLLPSARTTDAEFMRRVYLDITGIIPSATKAQSFIESRDPEKRAKLIRELLADARYGQRLSDLWIWQMFPNDSDNRALSREPLAKWLTDTFNANRPWNQMAYDLLTATGTQDEKGEVTYYLANRGVDKMTDSVGKLFLGVQIQCAQCHNHPFSDWKQTEYWGLAQFFYKVDAQAPKNAKSDTIPALTEDTKPNRKALPISAKNVPAKFLGGSTPALDRAKPYRPVLAHWITSDDNPFFAKAMVNRVWAQFFGRGLVNPIDDLRPENEPTHPEVLNLLSTEFIKSGYDLKHLIECICRTDAYQRSSLPNATNKADDRLYSHQLIKVLSGEQLYDCLDQVVGFGSNRPAPTGKDNKRVQVTPRDRFTQFFMGSENAKSTEYEAGIPQALRLINNPKINTSPKLIQEISQVGVTPNGIIDRLYLMTLSRLPTPAEMQKMVEYTTAHKDVRTAYGDVLWALLNSSEFALNR